jgi:polyisoprenoid-binding protein YceI
LSTGLNDAILLDTGEDNINKLNLHLQTNTINMAIIKWALDPTHAEIMFKVKHLLISKVTGQFQKFDASVETEGEDLETAKVHFTADIDSISTNNAQRDAHLKNSDFFDSENHAQLSFEGKGLEKIDEENYKLPGTLTMRGTSKEEVFNVEFGGKIQDPWGNTRVGFTLTGKIDRRDYGVSFGMVNEAGGVLLGYEVDVHAQVEFVQVK